MSTVLTKSSSAKVHSKRPHSDHSAEVGQLIPRFILSLSRLGRRRGRAPQVGKSDSGESHSVLNLMSVRR